MAFVPPQKPFIPERHTAWFSSSVPKSAIDEWVKFGGIVKPNACEAEFLFSENIKTEDVQRLFKSKMFLECHLTIFSSDVIFAAVKKNLSYVDVREFLLLPQKKCNDDRIDDASQSEEFDVSPKAKSDNCDASKSSNNVPKTVKSTNDTPHGDNCTRSVFYHSLNFDIIHLNDIRVAPVRLMDFKPGVDGCRVVKRRIRDHEEHSS